MKATTILLAAGLLALALPLVPPAQSAGVERCDLPDSGAGPAFPTCSFDCSEGDTITVHSESTNANHQWPRVRGNCGGVDFVCQSWMRCTASSAHVPSGGAGTCYVETVHTAGYCQVTHHPACRDTLDNDGDGRTDYPEDVGCTAFDADSETPDPVCYDGVDNDGDGFTDHPADPGCASRFDDTESTPCDPILGVVVCLAPAALVREVVVARPSANIGPQHQVAGYLDAYRFLVAGVSATLPCVILVVDGEERNPCADAGGSFLSREAVLVDTAVAEAEVKTDDLRVVGVCTAELTVTVRDFGVNSAPAYALC